VAGRNALLSFILMDTVSVFSSIFLTSLTEWPSDGKHWGFYGNTNKQITVFLKATSYSSMNNENAYGSKSRGKVFSIHAIKVYGVEV
jgi:hypothetical protein